MCKQQSGWVVCWWSNLPSKGVTLAVMSQLWSVAHTFVPIGVHVPYLLLARGCHTAESIGS